MSKVVVITSGKGGVGKTTTTANVATGIFPAPGSASMVFFRPPAVLC